MKKSISRSERDSKDLGIDRGGERSSRIWGFRTNFQMLVTILEFLNKAGPQTPAKIAQYLIRDSPGADSPNARRSTGMSSAIQVVVTLKNLGLAERADGQARLTEKGRGFALRIGTADQAGAFREILLASPSFVWFWGRVARSFKTIGRADLLDLAKATYPDYNEETRSTLVGICMNFARAAALVREGPGGRRYAVSSHRVPEFPDLPTAGRLPRTEAIDSAVSSDGIPASQDLVAGVSNLIRQMAYPLAKVSALKDPKARTSISGQFDQLVESDSAGSWKTLLALARDLAMRAFDQSDRDAAGWAVVCLHGVLDVVGTKPDVP